MLRVVPGVIPVATASISNLVTPPSGVVKVNMSPVTVTPEVALTSIEELNVISRSLQSVTVGEVDIGLVSLPTTAPYFTNCSLLVKSKLIG